MITTRHLAAVLTVALAAISPVVDWSTLPRMVDRAEALLEENVYAVGHPSDEIAAAVDTGLIPIPTAA